MQLFFRKKNQTQMVNMDQHENIQDKEITDCTQAQSSTLRTRVYITSFLTVASLSSMLSVFAMIKDRLNKDLHLDEAFLSYLESLYFMGKIVGTLTVLLFPTSHPKRTYFLICAFSSLCQLLIPLSINFPDVGRYMMLLGMAGIGVSKAYVLTPFLFLSEYFKKQEDKPIISVWNSLSNLGDVLGVVIGWMGVYQLQIRWDLVYDFCVCGYFVFAVVFYLSIEEKSFNQEKEQCQQQIQTQKLSILSKAGQSFGVILPFYSRVQNVLWCVDYSLQATFIICVVFWFPYYFVQHNFGFLTTFIIVAFYCSNVLGTVGFQFLLKKIGENNGDMGCFMMIVGQIAILLTTTLFIEPQKGNAPLYVMMVAFIGFLSGGVVNRIGTVDFLGLVRDNKQLKYYAIFSSRLIQGLVAILLTTLIGQLMKIDQRSLFYVMIGNLMMSLLVYGVRKFWIDDLQRLFDQKGYDEVEGEI